ncbi:DNA polymerase sliding clamp Pcn2 [Saccharolobus shibatae]|uniref:DNA polymerase sliding clamp n=1 Tax=Saccharolobus shibatae TaxID=2286 RepID=A0A8F5H0A1_9CREN|nr:DNA polymerase sliding clamp Pcn2 [Saccharolobus shibatae]QXJ32796.1 DNA polymerase sliding clamp protein PCNA [Saccharolobus shibatae]QXJ35925.1 DNA polymerase sliding clamp protein PCNA [Saccharolobus shibatae]
MKAKVIDAVSFSYILRTVGDFLSEANFIVTKEGIRVSGIDPSRVVFLDVFLPSSYFEGFEVNQDKEIIGFKLEDVNDVLKRVLKDDTLILSSNESKLTLTFDGEFTRSFELPLIQVETTQPPSVNLEFPFKAQLLTVTFADIIDELSDLGEVLNIYSKENKLYFEVIGDLATSRVELSTDSGTLLEASGADVNSSYGMEYVVNTTKMRRASDSMELYFGSQIPLKLRFKLPQEGYGDFYIAPRAE